MSQQLEIRPAEPRDSAGLLHLIDQTPQQGQVHLNFERNPDFFHATQVTTTEPDIWVMIDGETDTIIASFSIGKREVFVNGEKRMTRYGNDLRIHKDYRGGKTLPSLFKKYREVMQDEWMQVVILEENKASINSVANGRGSYPTFYQMGQFKTYMADLSKKQFKAVTHTKVRRATEVDKPLMQSFFDKHAPMKEFYPCYDFSHIGTDSTYYRGITIEDFFLAFRGDQLVGLCGVWDQKAFKQTRFVSYEGKMKVLRHVNNFKSKLLGGLQLPNPGNLASYLSVHSVVCENNDVAVFQDLLSTVLQAYYKGSYEALILGFDVRDPLHQACKSLKGYELLSNHYLASYAENPADSLNKQSLFHLEPTRL
jgi:hypothetical protein